MVDKREKAMMQRFRTGCRANEKGVHGNGFSYGRHFARGEGGQQSHWGKRAATRIKAFFMIIWVSNKRI